MDDIYREQILDHYKEPRNFGEIKSADALASKVNISCGDSVEVFIKLGKKDGKKVVEKMKFKGVGCALSIASASMLSEIIIDKEIDEIREMGEDIFVKMIGSKISAGRMKCVTLPLEALKAALKI